MSTAIRTDLKDPGLYEAGVPWDIFAALRRDDPVHWTPEADGAGFWSVLRHTDIVEVSRQPQLFSSAYENGGHRIFNENEVGLTGAGESAIGVPFISRDPPLHTRYRKFIMPALAPGRLGDIEARIRERVARLIDAIPLGEPVNLVPLLSAPLPLMTLAELLGVSGDLWPKLYDWTNAFVGEDDPEFRQSPGAMAATLGEFFAFAQDLFDARRAEPTPDIASLLANAEVDGVPVPFRDFVGNLILVLVGGNETTRNSLSHSVAAFSAHPDQWQAIRTDRDLLKTATAEMVRFASPVMHMRRTAMADTVIGGQKVAKGDKVVLWYISGNRDEQVFAEPDRFLVARRGAAHVGFGSGQHVCVGSRLAEMQLRVAFDMLADRVTSFEVQAPPRRFRSNFINGLKNLDVNLRPA
ncbi:MULTISPECIES: cytochrome P450 [unclassified Novosphingobium]|uniref:cytochrome P450 n=1 Tax=unclassified Novosphingobium TaxID=2644732 RepID=UPI00146A3BE7|nr:MULTISPECIES: cytochrome P450 [unclassified Novosphingobium]NMN04706.1 linalool 8-monooxygenase [Novosphingobium sp. SG919]NMN85300.1 linalool 8-monooxygenase [Novosphingobium sp. SG916]